MTTSDSTPQKRQAEIDAAYEAYDRHPLDEPDEWRDLASFHAANLRHKKEMQAGRAPDHDEVVAPLPNPQRCRCGG